jgi:RNA 2',3'-cyclic 3'-phosphodiesterase
MPRLFTGLEVPEPLRQRLTLHRGGLLGARWVEPESFHITLRFLGDVDHRLAHDFAEALDDIQCFSFTLQIAGLDVFGGDRPRSLIATIAPNRSLAELQAEHERAARRVGLPPETRRFTPHITLARLGRDASARSVADWLAAQGHVPQHSFSAGRFVLFSARASTGGGPYLVEADYPMLGAAA